MGGLQVRARAHAGGGQRGVGALNWKLVVSNRAKKDLNRLDKQEQARVWDALDKLAGAGEGDIRRLADIKPPEWRLRVGETRVRYAYIKEDNVILVLRVLPRGKAYDR